MKKATIAGARLTAVPYFVATIPAPNGYQSVKSITKRNIYMFVPARNFL